MAPEIVKNQKQKRNKEFFVDIEGRWVVLYSSAVESGPLKEGACRRRERILKTIQEEQKQRQKRVKPEELCKAGNQEGLNTRV